ncbi:ABC transporter transmembrane domain-containing protein [Frankia nepalensis]|uniref:ABC transporter transmembrane domain-containing protein n=1 Tax=Frankia nepalensis TaxID=1836974 RepID=UPI001DAEE736|nr:ABC transporter ATP-binding protein [Frankia nepalensis]MBL7510412.1 ABC transporter ATP-binding protein [Frankia nepalensis]
MLTGAIASQRRRILGSSLLGITYQGGEASVPIVIGVIIDRAVANGDGGALLGWLAVLLGVFVVLSLSYRFAARLGEAASEHAAHELRLRLTDRVLSPAGGAAAGRLAGELVNVATSDARRVGTVNMVIPMALAALAGMVVTSVALFRMSTLLGLTVLGAVLPLIIGAQLLAGPLERRAGAEQDRAGLAAGVAADLVSGLRVLKGLRAEPAALARYRLTSQEARGAAVRAAAARGWNFGGLLGLTGVYLTVVALVAARLALSGSISVGELVAAVGLAQFQLAPLGILAFANGEYVMARASAHRVAEVLAAPPAVAAGTDPPAALATPVRGRLELRGVTHGPLAGLDLAVAAGTMVGVVTADPAAATALLAVLGREADPAAGAVALDGVDLTLLDPATARGAILVAAHDADLFDGTVEDNVAAAVAARFASGGADRAAWLERALAAAAADEVCAALPDGAASGVGERGQALSGGQRQRVALARALAADAPVLVLHDPTTAVDAVTEARVAAGLRSLRAGRTTLLVTTSPALLDVADRVVLIADGAVAADSTHHDLVDARDDYRTAVLA